MTSLMKKVLLATACVLPLTGMASAEVPSISYLVHHYENKFSQQQCLKQANKVLVHIKNNGAGNLDIQYDPNADNVFANDKELSLQIVCDAEVKAVFFVAASDVYTGKKLWQVLHSIADDFDKEVTQQDDSRPSPPPPVATGGPACFASSDDGVVNVRETPNGVLIGPIPSGTPLTVLGTYPTNRQWSRVQTPWLARVGRVGADQTNIKASVLKRRKQQSIVHIELPGVITPPRARCGRRAAAPAQ